MCNEHSINVTQRNALPARVNTIGGIHSRESYFYWYSIVKQRLLKKNLSYLEKLRLQYERDKSAMLHAFYDFLYYIYTILKYNAVSG